MNHIIIIGGGPAGMIAAISAAQHGAKVTLIEKGQLGRKLLMTGHGRCNVTNNTDNQGIMNAISGNKRFLHSALMTWNVEDMKDFLINHGCPLKEEDNHRLFPVSDQAADVLTLLEKNLKGANVDLHLNHTVSQLCINDQKCTGVVLNDGNLIEGDAVIIATGGMSYPVTGSTGDGYEFVKDYHRIIPPAPALVALSCTLQNGESVAALQGLTLTHVKVMLKDKKVRHQARGDVMITHFGLSGPVIINMSTFIQKNQSIIIDLLPDLDAQTLDAMLVKKLQNSSHKAVYHVLSTFIPERLSHVLLKLCDIDSQTKAYAITREQRLLIVSTMKQFTFIDLKRRSFKEAMITKGGIDLKEINPKTMASKKIDNLYFAGEVMDLDATTGGFNLQIAWTTGYVAGQSAALQNRS